MGEDSSSNRSGRSGDRQRGDRDLHRAFHRDLAGAEGKDQALALPDGLAVDGAAAGQDVHDGKRLIHPELVVVIHPDVGEGEVGAADQFFPVVVWCAAGLLGQGRGLVGALDHVLALLDMQGTGFAVLQAVIIVQSVGDIAALLDFQQDGACADGVHRARAM